MIDWTEQQKCSLDVFSKWYEDRNSQVFRLFGYAGTGKTTLAKYLAKGKNVSYAAFTGKAASVMRKNGCFGAKTIHSLIYKPVVNDKTGEVSFKLNNDSEIRGKDLIIIDECSMVDQELGEDLLSFKVPILVLGDPAQLPPVKGAGFFTNHQPDFMLTEIHRQAENNPIIYMANRVRNGLPLSKGKYGSSLVLDDIDDINLIKFDQIIVGLNSTRQSINKKIREMYGYSDIYPISGDKIICLKNDKQKGIFNGAMFDVKQSLIKKDKGFYYNYRIIDDENKLFDVKCHASLFNSEIEKPHFSKLRGTQEFDFGYAITCHKSQGSQWEKVLVFNESNVFGDNWNRWLYTAITRSQKNVVIINDY